MDSLKSEVALLVKKAAQADKADDAMKFSQAAVNSANAMCALAIAIEKANANTLNQ